MWRSKTEILWWWNFPLIKEVCFQISQINKWGKIQTVAAEEEKNPQMHERFVNPFSRVIYNTKWASERGYQFQVSFSFLKTHRPVMTGRQQGQGRVFLAAVRKKQIISALVFILECKFPVIPTPKQQKLLHLEIMGAIILQEQQTMVGKRSCSE